MENMVLPIETLLFGYFFIHFFFDIMRILGILHFEIFNLTSLIHISLMEQPDEYSFLNIH